MIPESNRQFFVLLLMLIVTGLTAVVTGVFYFDNETGQNMTELQSVHHPAISGAEAVIHDFDAAIRTIDGTPVLDYQGQERVPLQSQMEGAAERGITVGELMRVFGILSVITAIAILLWIEFIDKERMTRQNYRVLLIVSLFVLPVLVGLSTTTTVLETTKTVQSCASCHVMDPFVNDLTDEASTTLAARHYKNGWIVEYQCYTCHTTYGAHGTFEGKRDGFRHWLLFVTRTWEDPIRYAGSYPNMNCTACHGGTTAFRDVPSHLALISELRSDEVSCTSCHGPAHPVPGEREQLTGPEVKNRGPYSELSMSIDKNELLELTEMIHDSD